MKKPKIPAVYITTNKPEGTLYTGVTSDLAKRVYEHKNNITRGFTAQYNCKMLVYYEVFETMAQAITREKRLKKYLRDWKINLINGMNPDWRDLYDDVIW
jgi:putative endonuclease